MFTRAAQRMFTQHNAVTVALSQGVWSVVSRAAQRMSTHHNAVTVALSQGVLERRVSCGTTYVYAAQCCDSGSDTGRFGAACPG